MHYPDYLDSNPGGPALVTHEVESQSEWIDPTTSARCKGIKPVTFTVMLNGRPHRIASAVCGEGNIESWDGNSGSGTFYMPDGRRLEGRIRRVSNAGGSATYEYELRNNRINLVVASGRFRC